jgi:hypothetical protein
VEKAKPVINLQQQQQSTQGKVVAWHVLLLPVQPAQLL